jgi:hypothetical protein
LAVYWSMDCSYGLQYRAVSIYKGVKIGVVVGEENKVLEGGFDRLLVGIRLLWCLV